MQVAKVRSTVLVNILENSPILKQTLFNLTSKSILFTFKNTLLKANFKEIKIIALIKIENGCVKMFV